MRRRLLLGVILLALGWFAVSAAAAHLVSRRPRPPYPEAPPAVDWAEVETVELEANDGARVRGHAFSVEDALGAVLLLHMNQADRGAMLPAARIWARLGWSSLAVSLRGHGDAEGERLDYGIVARLDAAAAAAWARTRFEGPLIVHGVSLGAASALLAVEAKSLTAEAYVLEAPFTSARAAVHDRTAMRLPPLLDQLAAWSLLAVAPLFVPGLAEVSPLEAAGALPEGTPVLLLAGTLDRRAPVERVRRFLEAIGESASFEAADVGHARWQSRPELLEQVLRRWLDDAGLPATPR